MESRMKKTLRRQKSAYALSLIFCLAWLAMLIATLWKTWPGVSSAQNSFSTFVTLLWTETLDFIPGLEFKLIYLNIIGDAMLISGVLIWVLSRQWFLLPGETMLFQCSFCKKKWRARRDEGLIHCPHCRQLVHPKMIER
jgi:DNA-directed RNA polymerase subunit RPC12/RpoP